MIDSDSHVQLDVYRAEFETAIQSFMARFLPGPEDLNTMIRYHFGWVDENGMPAQAYSGKQLRPLLLLLSTEASGGDWRLALPGALAVELLHNFSLVHDDIEDNSPLRRGRPTLWKLWGIANAINIGDVLFSLAHMALAQLAETRVKSNTIVQAIAVFEHMCLQLTRGQHLDMRFEKDAVVSVDDYLEMISGKSAALLAASMQIGALVAGLSEAQATEYAHCGHLLGMAFQIQDDVLGIWGNPTITGKSAATDIQSRKKTLPVLYGLHKDPELADLYAAELDEAAVGLIVDRLTRLGAKQYANALSEKYFQELRELFAILTYGNPEAQTLLKSLSFSLLGRVV